MPSGVSTPPNIDEVMGVLRRRSMMDAFYRTTGFVEYIMKRPLLA
jgi:hypothetical protein